MCNACPGTRRRCTDETSGSLLTPIPPESSQRATCGAWITPSVPRRLSSTSCAVACELMCPRAGHHCPFGTHLCAAVASARPWQAIVVQKKLARRASRPHLQLRGHRHQPIVAVDATPPPCRRQSLEMGKCGTMRTEAVSASPSGDQIPSPAARSSQGRPGWPRFSIPIAGLEGLL